MDPGQQEFSRVVLLTLTGHGQGEPRSLQKGRTEQWSEQATPRPATKGLNKCRSRCNPFGSAGHWVSFLPLYHPAINPAAILQNLVLLKHLFQFLEKGQLSGAAGLPVRGL